MTGLLREIRLLSRDSAALLWLGIAMFVAVVSVFLGLREIASQRTELNDLIAADRLEREVLMGRYQDWGEVAYYTFHLTYAPPSEFAFAAQGQRDTSPWKHNIRALALEGQIYETDAENPDFALIGRLDFAFVANLLAPLLLILLLHDLRSAERAAGRYELLCATAASQGSPWLARAALRVGALALCLIGAGPADCLPDRPLPSWPGEPVVVLHIGFWWAVCALMERFWLEQRGG